jgi:hypothetical protein
MFRFFHRGLAPHLQRAHAGRTQCDPPTGYPRHAPCWFRFAPLARITPQAAIGDRGRSMKKEELISEIEDAFGRFPPRGLRITIDSDMGDYPDVRNHFHHRDWWTCNAEYLGRREGAFTFMTDEAKVYFTPAFMLASLRSPEAALTVHQNFVWNLKESLLRHYNPPQLRAVINFIEFHLSDMPWTDRDLREILAVANGIEQNAAGQPATRPLSK